MYTLWSCIYDLTLLYGYYPVYNNHSIYVTNVVTLWLWIYIYNKCCFLICKIANFILAWSWASFLFFIFVSILWPCHCITIFLLSWYIPQFISSVLCFHWLMSVGAADDGDIELVHLLYNVVTPFGQRCLGSRVYQLDNHFCV